MASALTSRLDWALAVITVRLALAGGRWERAGSGPFCGELGPRFGPVLNPSRLGSAGALKTRTAQWSFRLTIAICG